MICARACPSLKVRARRVPKKAQNSYICTFEHINVDQSAIAARVCDFKLFKLVTSAG